jgi:hypothetical protein
VALPAGIPAAAGPYPVIVIQQPAVAQPRVSAPQRWSRDLEGFFNE